MGALRRGLKIDSFFGHFIIRGSDLLALPVGRWPLLWEGTRVGWIDIAGPTNYVALVVGRLSVTEVVIRGHALLPRMRLVLCDAPDELAAVQFNGSVPGPLAPGSERVQARKGCPDPAHDAGPAPV